MSKASERAQRMKAMFSEAPSNSTEAAQPPARSAPAGAVRSLESSLSRIEEENEALRKRIVDEQPIASSRSLAGWWVVTVAVLALLLFARVVLVTRRGWSRL